MYEIIATEDFINILKDIPLRHIATLTNSFLSVKRIDSKPIPKEKATFISDLLKEMQEGK